MAKVLITYGWCRTAYLAVRSLYAQGHEIYSCSHLLPSMSAWSRYTQGSAVVPDPFSEPEAFISKISVLIKRWKIDLIMPGHEDALVLREFESLLPNKPLIACPQLDDLKIGLDKLEITMLANRLGISTPRTLVPACVSEAMEMVDNVGYPVVVKLARSNSAKGVDIVNTKKELLDTLIRRMNKSDSNPTGQFPYLQSFHHGQIVGGCFFADHGKILGYFGERYIRVKNGEIGTSVFREYFNSPELEKSVNEMVRALNWNGIGHFDFINEVEKRKLLLLEMNPRPWGAINLAYINGYDFIGATVASTLGMNQLDKFFQNKSSHELRSMWIIGEGIRVVQYLIKGDFCGGIKAIREILNSLSKTKFDDFLWKDPLPLFAETFCYTKGFIKSGGNINPG